MALTAGRSKEKLTFMKLGVRMWGLAWVDNNNYYSN
jgi:microsomal dipeptidase-like Zn-dependent dipeptidase